MLGSWRRILPSPIRIFQPPLKEATSDSASSGRKPIVSITFSTYAREEEERRGVSVSLEGGAVACVKE